jgi:hypothetical protein
MLLFADLCYTVEFETEGGHAEVICAIISTLYIVEARAHM